MIAFVCQKVVSEDIDYGVIIGGKANTGLPERIRNEILDNVTSVIETTDEGIPVYQITHKTGDDEFPHTNEYNKDLFNVSIIGG